MCSPSPDRLFLPGEWGSIYSHLRVLCLAFWSLRFQCVSWVSSCHLRCKYQNWAMVPTIVLCFYPSFSFLLCMCSPGTTTLPLPLLLRHLFMSPPEAWGIARFRSNTFITREAAHTPNLKIMSASPHHKHEHAAAQGEAGAFPFILYLLQFQGLHTGNGFYETPSFPEIRRTRESRRGRKR